MMSTMFLRFIVTVFLIVSFSRKVVIASSFDLIPVTTVEQNDHDHQRNVVDDGIYLQHPHNDVLSFHQMTNARNPSHYISSSSSTEQHKKIDNNVMNRLLDDYIIQNNDEDFKSSSFHRMALTTTGCIRNQKDFEMAILNSPDNSLVPTDIRICKEYINIDTSIPNSYTGQLGIHVINKFLNVRCIINVNKKCIINAQGKSRHFIISNSTLTFNRITFINGNVKTNDYYWGTGAYGGSLYITSYERVFIPGVTSSNIVINNCDFINNAVTAFERNNFGGAIHCDNCNMMKLNNVNMINNSALYNYGDGGAIKLSGGNYILINVSFYNNTCQRDGGAVSIESGTINMTNVSFRNNKAGYRAGAILSYANNMTLDNVTMENNEALYSGAIYSIGAIAFIGNCEIARIGKFEITNSLFRNNTATSGGAIDASYDNLVLNNVVFTNNSAKFGILSFRNMNLDVKNTFFSGSIVDVEECDMYFREFVKDYELIYRYSQLNLRKSPPPRTLQQTQTIQESFLTIATQTSPQKQQIQACVTSYMALRKQVRLCNKPCAITICRAQIKMSSIVVGLRPINLSNKTITINCDLKNYKRCMIDGQGLSRIFYGSNVNITFRNMIFANGYSSESGGALYLNGNSTANLFNCSFFNNSASTGGAVMITDTIFYMAGSQSSFINNTGNSPPLVVYSSNLTLYDTLFEGNSKGKYGNGILLFGSKIEFFNNNFAESKDTLDHVCNIVVAFDPKNPKDDATCLDTDESCDEWTERTYDLIV